MSLYISKPQHVEAVQHTGDFQALREFAGEKVTIRASDGSLMLLCGVDGAQEWVAVPVGHWIVHPPGDLSDIWPVEDRYFREKYREAVEGDDE